MNDENLEISLSPKMAALLDNLLGNLMPNDFVDDADYRESYNLYVEINHYLEDLASQ